MKQSIMVAAVLAALSSAVMAEEDLGRGGRVGVTLEGALEFGGDDVATVFYTNGDSQDVQAGQGVTVAIGGHFRPAETSPFELRATVGYKFVSTMASNADIGMDRVTWKLIGSVRNENGFWIGAGPVRHTNIQFDAAGLGPNVSFDDATGVAVEAGWRFLALSYTNIDYIDEFGGSYDASNIGLLATWGF